MIDPEVQVALMDLHDLMQSLHMMVEADHKQIERLLQQCANLNGRLLILESLSEVNTGAKMQILGEMAGSHGR